jgi:hypothetical protein
MRAAKGKCYVRAGSYCTPLESHPTPESKRTASKARRVAHRVRANHNPLAMSARSLSRPGALETELAGVDIPSETRPVGVRQLWLPVPFAVLVSALGQADFADCRWIGRRPSAARRFSTRSALRPRMFHFGH